MHLVFHHAAAMVVAILRWVGNELGCVKVCASNSLAFRIAIKYSLN